MGANRPDHVVKIIMVNDNRLFQMLTDMLGKIYSGDRRPLFFTDAEAAIQAATEVITRYS